ncbi:MAG TPA: thiamine biosynthesis protein ThiS [Elusimicrobia bacterium]|nr:thiamine biosynthesis protein ThiS [Elusimicrobiota bacterium]
MPVLYFNDKQVETPEGTSLKELLKLQGRDPVLVVVTVDGKFVPGAEYAALVLQEGARVIARELLSGG